MRIAHRHAGHARIESTLAAVPEPLIAADAKVAVGDDLAQLGGVARRRVVEAIDIEVVVAQALHLRETHGHSHSIVAGGLLLISYTTRLMPLTLLMIRIEIFASNS